MKRVLILTAAFMVLGIPSANAAKTGQVCDHRTHGSKTYDVCAYVQAFANGIDSENDDQAWGGATDGATNQGAIEIDYVRLWQHTFFPDEYVLRAANEANSTFPNSATSWDKVTPLPAIFNCRGSGNHSRLHAEIRYQITWPNGDLGAWHILNSNEQECQV